MSGTRQSATPGEPADPADIHIVNSQLGIPMATVQEPLRSGFIHIAAEIDRILPYGLRPASRNKREAIAAASSFADRLERLAFVNRVDVFVATLLPPGTGSLEGHSGGPRARFDLVVLIETTDTESAAKVQDNEYYLRLLAALKERSRYLHVMRAHNLVNLGKVDGSRDGLFLFNYFHADDRSKIVPVFERTAGWFETYTKLHNSMLLGPEADTESRYVINHCRWCTARAAGPERIVRPYNHRATSKITQSEPGPRQRTQPSTNSRSSQPVNA